MTANPFTLAAAARLRGGAGSQWMRFLPPRNSSGNVVNLLARGVLARQQGKALQHERAVRDPDLVQGAVALSLFAGGLPPLAPDMYLNAHQLHQLIVEAYGTATLDVEDPVVHFKTDVRSLWNPWPKEFPVQPDDDGNVIINPTHWAAWVADIRAGNSLGDANVPCHQPQGSQLAAATNELHPWALAGYHSLNIQDATHVPILTGVIPVILEYLAVYALSLQRGNACRNDILNLLVLGVTILTSGGNISNTHLRKGIKSACKETSGDIDFTRETVTKGWSIFNKHWAHQCQTSQDIEAMFNALRQVNSPVCPGLALAFQQTELKMLTGILTIIRAISTFQDFPWQDLNNVITRLTGVNELVHVNAFADYLEPPEEADGSVAGGGHWSGWTFALGHQTQEHMRNKAYPNLLYAALQLCIHIGGNMSLRGYKGTENITIPARPVIDAWVAAYQAGQGAQQTPWPSAPAEDGVEIQNIRAKSI